MKRLTLGALALAFPLAAPAASETYVLDPHHTFAHFAVDYLGYATLYGRFDKTSGQFTVDAAAKSGTLQVAIDTASATTGDLDRGARPRSRDEHLRTPDFFNVAEFPRMTYQSTSVRFSGDSPAEIEGNLSLLGVSRPLTLKVERWLCKAHPFYKKIHCGGNASGTLKRSDFGMKYAVPALGDDIRITIMFLGAQQ